MGKPKKPTNRNPPQFFDRIFKRLMQLSSGTIINFINGLFGKDYPPDSIVTLLSTEHTTEFFKQVRGDMVIEINHTDKYLIEIQTADDAEMALRIFNYTYLDAVRTKTLTDNHLTLNFSQAIVIYLEPTAQTPTELITTLNFPGKAVYTVSVPTMRFLDCSIVELEERNLSILLPFYLLKLRKQIKAARSSKKRQELSGAMKKLMEEILETVERSEAKGLMSKGDMSQVIEMIGRIYDTLYKPYNEFKESNDMVNGMILTYSEEAALKAEKQAKARFAQYLVKKGWDSTEIAEATKLDFPDHIYPDDTTLTYLEEAALKVEKQARQDEKVHFAQKLIQKGWVSTEIAETTGLDRETVESLYATTQP